MLSVIVGERDGSLSRGFRSFPCLHGKLRKRLGCRRIYSSLEPPASSRQNPAPAEDSETNQNPDEVKSV